MVKPGGSVVGNAVTFPKKQEFVCRHLGYDRLPNIYMNRMVLMRMEMVMKMIVEVVKVNEFVYLIIYFNALCTLFYMDKYEFVLKFLYYIFVIIGCGLTRI